MSHVHLVGIGGAGLSAIATVLLQQGYTVSGSDMQDSEAVVRLRELGAEVTIGHRPENITTPDVVVISSAIPANNPEVLEAQARQIPVLKRPAWLGNMMTDKRGIAIAGTHGKTTTTAMVAMILEQADLSPTYIIGGFVPQLNNNAAAGKSNLFVIEADEYDHTFLSLKPEIAIITNIEHDHPDIYPTEASLHQAFTDFVNLIPAHGQVFVCGDDYGVQKLLSKMPNAITYGFDATNTWQAVNIRANDRGSYNFEVQYAGNIITSQPVTLTIPGLHNVRNGLAALIVATKLGVSIAEATHTLSEFSGATRRFELKGEVKGITIIDDYAHNPTEIKATLAAARTRFGERPLWAVFQPHTFSRTILLLEQFAAAFDRADHVILLDIFPSREKDDGSVSSADVVARMEHPDARYLGQMTEAITYLQDHLSPGDVLITLGAGDGYKVGETILEK
jgi:UDP-N-acetylmuramate--alanine ligase